MERYSVMYNTDKELACCFTCVADSKEAAWDIFCSEVRSEVDTYLESIHESYYNPTLRRILSSFKDQKIMIRGHAGDEIQLGSQWLDNLDRNVLLDRMFILRNESSDKYDLCITLC